MIISVSRRTDIPAFYSDWFFNRLKEGFVYVQNPFNTKQISKVSLDKKAVDCIVFWTKDPSKMIDKLELLKEYNYYFQITVTAYGKEVERSIANKKEIIQNIKKLSNIIGKEKVVIRYDPIFINAKYTLEYHIKAFNRLVEELGDYTERIVISFIDLYRKTERNTKELNIEKISKDDVITIAKEFVEIAKKKGVIIETCSEEIDLKNIGINHGKCIDDKVISKILNRNITISKDKNQREICGCVKSIDIGQYNSCLHNCLYCYANFNNEIVIKSYKNHNPNSPLLIGRLEDGMKVTEKKVEKLIVDSEQISFEI